MINLNLTPQELQIVLAVLYNQPYGQVSPVCSNIETQIEPQIAKLKKEVEAKQVLEAKEGEAVEDALTPAE